MQELKSTNIVFDWERDAMEGKPAPEHLEYPERKLYREIRSLYHQYKIGAISRSTAVRDKMMLIRDYKCDKNNWELVQMSADLIKRTERARAEYRRNRTLENADKLVEAIDGMKIKRED